MAKKVRKIPATLNQFISEPVAVRRKKKVAGYARVSTDREEQATSYEAQMTYYKTYIEGHEDWEFVGMYSDEGTTATNTKKRDGFNQMVEDALDVSSGNKRRWECKECCFKCRDKETEWKEAINTRTN